MLRSGPIAFFVHGLLEYAAALASFIVPTMFDFGAAATTWSYVVGVAIVLIALTTDGPSSLVARIPINAHVVLDCVLVAALVASPWVLGFNDQDAPTRWFVGLGLVHLALTLLTRFVSSDRPHVGSLAAGTSVTVEAEGSGPGAGRG